MGPTVMVAIAQIRIVAYFKYCIALQKDRRDGPILWTKQTRHEVNLSKRHYDLPPMTALVAFEAAARHVGFKPAARELNVTPAAISHQVKALESELHCALFYRHHRGVELTETGAYLLVALQRGF